MRSYSQTSAAERKVLKLEAEIEKKKIQLPGLRKKVKPRDIEDFDLLPAGLQGWEPRYCY